MHIGSLLLQSLVALVSGVVIAVVSSAVTVKMSVKQFHSQKWWERKEETYSRIIRALFCMKRFAEDKACYLCDPASNARDQRTVHFDDYDAAIDEVEQETALGPFVISVEAGEALEKLRGVLLELRRFEREGVDSEELAWAERDAVGECLKVMLNCAKRDLDPDGTAQRPRLERHAQTLRLLFGQWWGKPKRSRRKVSVSRNEQVA